MGGEWERNRRGMGRRMGKKMNINKYM